MSINGLLPGVRRNVPLKNYTTFKIGGPAKYFFAAKTKENLIRAAGAAKKLRLPFFILGGGSNILVADKGYKGLVINFQFSIFNFQKNKIIAGAGTKLGELVSVSAKRGLTGLEWAAGIPGTVGGAIRGCAGAFDGDVSKITKEVEALDVSSGQIKVFSKKKCFFEYRGSIFKKNKNLVILSATFQLSKGEKEKIESKIKEFRGYRKNNHPLKFPSAGSVFKSVDLKEFKKDIFAKYPEIKKFSDKVPAGFLVEQAGLKGKKIGGAQISEKHANFIINLGNGKAKDVKKLINLAKKEVKRKFRIAMEEEIQPVGF